MKEKILKLTSTKLFHKTVFFLGILFIVVSIFAAFDPKPFLKLGYLGVFIFSIFGAGSIIVAALSQGADIFLLTLTATAGIALNDSFSWFVGKNGAAVIKPSKKIQQVEKTVVKYGWPALFFFALIPFPYDFVSAIAGYVGFPYKKFIIPTFIGKFLRVLVLSWLLLYLLPQR